MDTAKAKQQLQALTTWRNQLVGIGLVPPDVAELLTLIEDSDGKVKTLVERKASLEREAAGLDAELASRRREGERVIQEDFASLKASLEAQTSQDRQDAAAAKEKAENARGDLAVAERAAQARIAELEARIAEKEQAFAMLTENYEAFKRKAGLA